MNWSTELYTAKRCFCYGNIYRIATFPDGSKWKQCQSCWDISPLLDSDNLELMEQSEED